MSGPNGTAFTQRRTVVLPEQVQLHVPKSAAAFATALAQHPDRGVQHARDQAPQGWSDQAVWKGPEENMSKAALAASAVESGDVAAVHATTLPPQVLAAAGGGEAAALLGSKGASDSAVTDGQGLTAQFHNIVQQAKQVLVPIFSGTAAAQPPWLIWPDTDPVGSVNGIIAGLWPELSQAVAQLVKEQVEQMLPSLLHPPAPPQDSSSTAGSGSNAQQHPPNSSSVLGGVLQDVRVTKLDLGSVPLRLDGLKVYRNPGEESLMLEAHVAWGSAAEVCVEADLQLLGQHITLPLTVRSMQVTAHARAVLAPLLSDYPFAGSVMVTLMQPPHVDFQLPVTLLKRTLDVMSFPLVPSLVSLAVKLACRQLVQYPKSLQLDLVPGGGRQQGPAGMLTVRLVKMVGLRSEDLIGHSDPYCIVQVKDGRSVRTRTVDNNNAPEFNEEFTLLVDDPDTQRLRLVVKDDDYFGDWTDKVLGWADLPLKEGAFMRVPRTTIPLTLRLHKWEGLPSAGPLELPAKLLGLPLSLAAVGGRAIVNTATGMASSAGGVMSGSEKWPGGKKGRFMGEGHRDPGAPAVSPDQPQQLQQPPAGHTAPGDVAAGQAPLHSFQAAGQPVDVSSGHIGVAPATKIRYATPAPVSSSNSITSYSSSTSSSRVAGQVWSGANQPGAVDQLQAGPDVPRQRLQLRRLRSHSDSETLPRVVAWPALLAAESGQQPSYATSSTTSEISYPCSDSEVATGASGREGSESSSAKGPSRSRKPSFSSRLKQLLTGSSAGSDAGAGTSSSTAYGPGGDTNAGDAGAPSLDASSAPVGTTHTTTPPAFTSAGAAGTRQQVGQAQVATPASTAAAPNTAASSLHGAAPATGPAQHGGQPNSSSGGQQAGAAGNKPGAGSQMQQLERLKQAAGADPNRQHLTERVRGGRGGLAQHGGSTTTSSDKAPGGSQALSAGDGGRGKAEDAGAAAGADDGADDIIGGVNTQEELQKDMAALGRRDMAMAAAKGQDQMEKKVRGTAFLEVTYIPFKRPASGPAPTSAGGAPSQDHFADTAVPATTGQAAAATPATATGMHAALRRGILTVTVVKAARLVGWMGEPDPYVKLELFGSKEAGQGAGAAPQCHKTTVMFNEDHPRWNETFDFIMVSAGSQLLVTLMDKVTLAEIATSTRIKDRFKDHVLGRAKVDVADVAAAGHLRRMYALQGALLGGVELSMQWIPAELAE